MPTYAQPPKKTFTPVPAGTHIARLFSIIHIGTTGYEYMGEWKESYKVRLTFELPLKTKVFNEEKGEQPMVISEEYGLTMGSKSKLRKVVEGIIGTTLIDKEAYAFDIEDLLGEPCLIRVVHKTKGDKTFANIESTSPLMEGQECPPQVNPDFVLSYADWNQEKFDSLPEFIKDKIRATGEYRAKTTTVPDMKAVREELRAKRNPKEYGPDEIDPDSIPF